MKSGLRSAQTCLKCHTLDGKAENSQFILKDPDRSVGGEKDEALRHNRDAFVAWRG